MQMGDAPSTGQGESGSLGAESFDALLSGAASETPTAPAEEAQVSPTVRAPWLILLSVGAALLGGFGIAFSLLAHSATSFGSALEDRIAAEAQAEMTESRGSSPSPRAPAGEDPPGGTFVLPDQGSADSWGVDPEWVGRVSTRTDIPERALTAYAEAALRVSKEQPLCGLGWNTLAAIGFVETDHGRYGGAVLGVDGLATPTIIGVALDGSGTDAISDTDHGRLDGDPVWDRAVGPMQFIPSTWAEWGADGDGDGIADPQDIDDAAYSAARYLCASGGDLRESGNWIDAVAAYNDTIDYNHRVAAAAEEYAHTS